MQPKNVRSILAIGDKFDYAFLKIAISLAENGSHIWFISPASFEKIPENISPPTKEILQLITFMYLKDYTDLITQLNAIHIWHKTPTVIILTNLELYCNLYSSAYNPLHSALVVTTLLDSAAVCATKNNTTINLLVSCTEPSPNNEDRLQLLNDLYFCMFVYKSQEDEFCNKVMEIVNR